MRSFRAEWCEKHIDGIAEEFVRGNKHRLGQFGHFIHI